MATKIKKCLIVSGAPENSIDYINIFRKDAFVISADSGYYKCKKLGFEPDLAVGDFDSSPVPKTTCELVILSPHKDDTDTLYAIKKAISLGYNHLIIAGGIGNRFDHTLSNVVNIDYCHNNGVYACLVNEKSMIAICYNTLTINNYYKYFSLFAFGGDCEDLCIDGAEYCLTNYHLTADSSICQSNQLAVNSSYAKVKIKSGKLLVVCCNE